jgi:hypothetical protein
MCQLYNPHKWMFSKSECFYYYNPVFGLDPETSCHFGSAMVACLYYPIDEKTSLPMLDRPLLIESYHFPTDNALKTRVCEYLVGPYEQEKEKVFGKISNVIRVGDFNLFKDHSDYHLQLKLLTTNYKSCNDVMYVYGGINKRMYGTFYPFPHDQTSIEIAKPYIDAPNTSQLDYMFLSNNSNLKCVETVLFESENPDRVEWDHYPLMCTFEYVK